GLVGPSGSGKSTVINLIAGLVRPARGRIEVGGTVLTDTAARVQIPPHKRGVGLVFQDAQLFPHLSVRRNLTYAHDFGRTRENGIRFDAVVDV
ncbi:ATP-binding cassette domain-containing protein, partial [Acinetobacter baumannii]